MLLVTLPVNLAAMLLVKVTTDMFSLVPMYRDQPQGSPSARAMQLGQWLQANTLVAHFFRYRLKNRVGQCRTMPSLLAVYETTDMATVSVASSI